MKSKPTDVEVDIVGLAEPGLGMAEYEGRTLHVRNALPGERVVARILKRRKGVLFADAVKVESGGEQRVAAPCRFFPRCGGCSLQHVAYPTQLDLKQDLLKHELSRCGIVPGRWAPPASVNRLGYRSKARLGVRKVGEQVFVGFRESFSNRVAQLTHCEILEPGLARLIGPLRILIGQLSIADKIPQIEFARGDGTGAVFVRHLAPFTGKDLALWHEFEHTHGVQVLLQSGGYPTLKTLAGTPADLLTYQIPEYGVLMKFAPQQFTQVNRFMNRRLIRDSISYLYDLKDKNVGDLFCGIGNFSIPLGRGGARVWAFELAEDAVDQGVANARLNRVANRVQFAAVDLYKEDGCLPPGLDALVLDPPRSGAGPQLPAWLSSFSGHEVVYVSCNPVSFANDAVHLKQAGFTLARVGIYDMFPHTAHVETMGYFVRAGQ